MGRAENKPANLIQWTTPGLDYPRFGGQGIMRESAQPREVLT